MPLTLVLGPANSAKAGEVLGAFAAAARTGAVLVVPTLVDVDHFGRELAQDGDAVLGSVLTFSGLAGEVGRRAGYAGARLSPLQRRRVLRRVLDRLPLESLRDSARSAGFAAAAGGLIAELERTLVTPARFAAALRAWAAADPRRAAYAGDLAGLYRGYADELDRIGRVDAELHAWRALDALRAKPAAWGRDAVFFYGFDELTPLERDAVETLSRIAGTDVTVSLGYEPGRAAFASRAETVEELRPLAQRVVELPAVDDYYEPESRAALHHLERGLFEAAPAQIDPGSAVTLLEAGGERAEAELIAAEILEAVRAGVQPGEIVIVCRSLLRSAALLGRVLGQYGVEAAVERRLPFAHTALGRGVLGLARCAWLDDAPARELLSYLRLPGLLRHPEVADSLELRLRQEAVHGVSHAIELLGWDLGELAQLRGARNPAAELVRQARRLLARPHRGTAIVLTEDEELDAGALAALARAVEELEELGERPRGEELIELLEELEVAVGNAGRERAVSIAEPLTIRARRFRIVFVCGLQEGEFPLPGAPEPFLSDELRRELAACSGLRLRLGEDAAARERYLFYACASRATGRLVLSYRSSDEEGNVEMPSPLIADVEDLLVGGWAARRRTRLLADVVWGMEEAPTPRERSRSEAAAGAGDRVFAEQPRRLSAAALGHVRHQRVVSAGALESYAECPVKWLVERELQPARLGPDPEPVARGNYMHAVLEELLRRLGGPVTKGSLEHAQEVLSELLRELPGDVGKGVSEPVRRGMLRSVEADLRRYLQHEAAAGCGWPSRGLELRFGFDGEEEDGLPAVALGDGGEQILLRGMIDRVDVDPAGSDRAIVRDYKSGGSRPEYQGARWREDRRLQVALYMIAVRRLLGLEPVAGLYQPLGGSDLRARGLFLEGAPVGAKVVATDARTPEGLQDALEDAQERAVAVAARLRGGEVEPCPETCSRGGCRYPGICRSQ